MKLPEVGSPNSCLLPPNADLQDQHYQSGNRNFGGAQSGAPCGVSDWRRFGLSKKKKTTMHWIYVLENCTPTKKIPETNSWPLLSIKRPYLPFQELSLLKPRHTQWITRDRSLRQQSQLLHPNHLRVAWGVLIRPGFDVCPLCNATLVSEWYKCTVNNGVSASLPVYVRQCTHTQLCFLHFDKF